MARIIDITDRISKEKHTHELVQKEVSGIIDAQKQVRELAKSLLSKSKAYKILESKIGSEEKIKDVIGAKENKKIKKLIDLLHKDKIVKFNKVLEKVVKLTQKKRDLNEGEMKELNELYSEIIQYCSKIKTMERLANMMYLHMRTMIRLLGIEESSIMKEEYYEHAA
jgi:hydroxymethylpyrimidine pyrophosphatase-like HAD family hydrolase